MKKLQSKPGIAAGLDLFGRGLEPVFLTIKPQAYAGLDQVALEHLERMPSEYL